MNRFFKLLADADVTEEKDLMSILGGLIVLGLIAVAIYGAFVSETEKFPRAIIGILAGGACVVIGGLIGFLFGIPRFVADKTELKVGTDNQNNYQPNTNLEQISDWLTKILVGVTLVQFGELRKTLETVAQGLGAAVGNQTSGTAFAMGLILFFLAIGFPLGYLWTRLVLPGAYQRADNANMDYRRILIDKDLETTILRQINLNNDAVSEDPLTEKIKAASLEARVDAFWKAQSARRKGDKELVLRTITIFNALIRADSEKVFYLTHAELGFAQLYLENYSAAAAAFEEAIKRRGNPKDTRDYALDLGYTRSLILSDEDYKSEKASNLNLVSKINTLLDTVVLDLTMKAKAQKDSDIAKWRTLNGLPVL
jgi:hypothetical protein